MKKNDIDNLRRKLRKRYRIVKLIIGNVSKYKIQEKWFIFFWTDSFSIYYTSYKEAFNIMQNLIEDELWKCNYWKAYIEEE